MPSDQNVVVVPIATSRLKQLAERLGWSPALGGWTRNGQWFSWDEATLRAAPDLTSRAWLSASRPLPTGNLSLKLDGQSQKEDRKAALNAALGSVWHEERAHSAFLTLSSW
eukprot:2953977-Amphidinium_carterae.1